MTAIRAHFLTGRYVAGDLSSGARRDRAEWPPHPARLFYALVDGWAALGKSEGGRRALEWLESQPPPEIQCSEAHRARVLETFVPVNDDIPSGSKAMKPDQLNTFLQAPFRLRKPRTFPAVVPFDPVATFTWPASAPDDVRQGLAELCDVVYRLGHSSSMVHLQLGGGEVVGEEAAWSPSPEGRTFLRVPTPGRLRHLESAFDAAWALSSAGDPRRRGRQPLLPPEPIAVAMPRPDLGPTARYRNRAEFAEVAPLEANGASSEWVVFRVDGPPLDLTRGPVIAELLREAILAHHFRLGGGEAPYLTGHAPGSTRAAPAPATTPHLAYIPLAFVGAHHADGHVLGVAVLIPAALAQAERRHARRVLGQVEELRNGGRVWALQRLVGEDAPWALRRARWRGPSRTWASVTPMVLDRLVKPNVGMEHPRVRDIVRAALTRAVGSEPDGVWVGPTSPLRGAPSVHDFPTPRGRGGLPPRRMVHVAASWPAPLGGPILAGAGRHGGYGLLAPLEDHRWTDLLGVNAPDPSARPGAPPLTADPANAATDAADAPDEDSE